MAKSTKKKKAAQRVKLPLPEQVRVGNYRQGPTSDGLPCGCGLFWLNCFWAQGRISLKAVDIFEEVVSCPRDEHGTRLTDCTARRTTRNHRRLYNAILRGLKACGFKISDDKKWAIK